MNAEDIQAQAMQPENKGRFGVYRRGESGPEVPVVQNVSEAFALSVITYLERNTHHQGYWMRNPDYTP